MTSDRAGAIALVIMFAVAATLISVAAKHHEAVIKSRVVSLIHINTDDEIDRQLRDE